MSTAYSTLLGLALPVTSELAGTWGDVVNNYITNYLDASVAGTQTLSTDADVTLTKTTGTSLGSTSSQYAIINCTGARTALRTITAPAASKIYIVINATTGGYSVKLVGAGPTTGLTIPNGASATVAWNGSDFVEIGGGTIGNLTVNGNLSVTGTSTLTGVATLTANPVFNGGTANGVLYLNGSKVATSGSALVFDGTNFGIGITPTVPLTVSKSVAGDWVSKLVNTNATNGYGLYVQGAPNASTYLIGAHDGSSYGFVVTGDFKVGIGTSSPAQKLHVASAGNNYIVSSNTSGSTSALLLGSESGQNTIYSWTTVAGSTGRPLAFYTGASESMRLDTSGNLGLGVTPSAWGSPFRAQQIGTGGSFIAGRTDGVSQVQVGANAYYNGTNWIYVNSSVLASRYYQNGGTHVWDTAPSGTAGNTITFTQSMTLDSSGNLGLGVTPSAWGATYKAIQVGVGGSVNGRTNTENQVALSANAFHNGTAWTYIASTTATQYQQAAGVHYWFTAPSGTAGNAITFTQAMTLDASGNLGVGTTSLTNTAGYATLSLNGSTGGQIAFQTAGTSKQFIYSTSTDITYRNDNGATIFFSTTERARITSGGNLYVGTTSSATDGRIVADGADAYYAGTFTQPSAASNCIAAHNRATSGDNAFVIFLTEGGSGTARGSITYNRAGGLTAYNTTSDYRAKDIIGPVQDPGATIDALKVYEGKMKGATQSRPMLIAHEAQEHAPYAVTGEKDAVNEDGTPKFQQMDVSSLVPLLLAEIQSLRARVAQLESK